MTEIASTRRAAIAAPAAAMVMGSVMAQPASQPATTSCLIIAPAGPVAAAVREALTAAGAKVVTRYPAAFTDAAYADAFLTGADKPGKTDLVVAIAIPERNGAVGKVKPADFQRVVVDNYGRMFLAMKHGIQVLRASGGGQFIAITSTDGRSGRIDAAAASAAANGITIMVKSATLECAQKNDNVRVNAVQVGDIVDAATAPKLGQVHMADVTRAVTYLAADGSAYLTGVVMPVDNGGAVS
jgi:NADP-dependent 3-hydroxy acid dehydrogenase YdfG